MAQLKSVGAWYNALVTLVQMKSCNIRSIKSYLLINKSILVIEFIGFQVSVRLSDKVGAIRSDLSMPHFQITFVKISP